MALNGRGVGITELLHGYAEWPVLVLFALVTQLGDVWFLFALGSALYVAGERLPRWGIDRRRGLFVLGLVLAYVALIGVLKHAFMLPRPPGASEAPALGWIPAVLQPVFADIATGHGPGFPSGHALGTTMVWGGVALILDRGTRRSRLAVAGTVVALVSLSRLVLGVHYAVDVVVGVALGLLALGALYRFSDGGTEPGLVLLFAVAAGVLGLFTGFTFDSVTALGGALGAWVAWRAVAEATAAHPSSGREVMAAVAVLAVAAALFGAVYALTPGLVVAFLGAVLAGGGAVGAPALGDRLAHTRS
ncbi:PAP2 superfamily protein [Halomicrobium zhouii]|uniref:PAP2 superfamily protein n=1 Tax=Halomicrobium zhouii TaxID=767519 RepID=A0A1I6K2S2_9EURY|nr:phosphatase PAP2 family protein [Halomicrobium zhouii]SFR85388.1 PAP2 superfamily protein [Halomicrobium zhouii]